MRLLFDENVPAWIADVFLERNHEILFVSDLLLRSTADEVIAVVGSDLNAIVVTRNWKDFREYTVRKLPTGTRGKLRGLGIIEIDCNPKSELVRFQQEVELIEFEYTRRLTSSDIRVSIVLKQNQVVIRR